MMKSGIGQPVRRVEDVRFVSGHGRYTDDIAIEGQIYAAFMRSPHAHARIERVDAGAARAAPDVVGVLTGANLTPLNLGVLTTAGEKIGWKGSDFPNAPKALLPVDKARFAGEALAMVLAKTPAAAQAAAELVAIDYEPLASAATLEAVTRAKGAPIWESAPDNRAFEWIAGDEAQTASAFAAAAHAISVDVVQNMLVCNAMEPRAALGLYDGARDAYTLHVPCQGVSSIRERLAADILKIPREKLRVLSPDVGGGFGMKAQLYAEQGLVLIAAKIFGAPVKWTGERMEGFLGDTHSRDARTHAELALDGEGKILAVRVRGIANMGAYFARIGPQVPTQAGMRILGGVYRVPTAHVHITGYFTNSMAIAPYRGAGRPEAAYLIERLMDKAARALGLDRLEIRRRNLVREEEIPYRNWAGFTFDSGEFAKNLEDAAARADWKGFATRRAEAKARGKKRGIGVAYYVELAGGNQGAEPARIQFTDNGAVNVYVGTQSNGQGHETSFAQIVAERLGVAFESVSIKEGDTDYGVAGMGSVGSRSTQTAGNAIGKGAEEVVRRGKAAAKHVLQAGDAEVGFAVEDGVGRFRVAGSDRSIGLADLALTLRREHLPEFESGLDADADFTAPNTFPNGCHICEVEIDPETGKIDVVYYEVVDDMGRIINPLLVEGQVHGGVAQGLGQVLMEECVYDGASGQLLTASFNDYAMPRAEDVPNIGFSYNEVLCATNPLGAKGAGEAGTIGAMPAIVSAIADALDVEHIDMPVTPEKVWRVLSRQGR